MFNGSTLCPVWGREAGFSKEAEEASARIAGDKVSPAQISPLHLPWGGLGRTQPERSGILGSAGGSVQPGCGHRGWTLPHGPVLRGQAAPCCRAPPEAAIPLFKLGFQTPEQTQSWRRRPVAGVSSEGAKSREKQSSLMNVLLLRCKNNNNQFYINLFSTKRLESTSSIPKVQGVPRYG